MENSYLGRSWYFVTFSVADYPPPPPPLKIQISNFFPKTKSEVAEYPPPPPPKNCQKSWHFDFSVAEYPPPPTQISNFFPKSEVAEYPPPPQKIVRNLGTLTFQLQNTPPPERQIVRNLGTLTFQLQNTPPPPPPPGKSKFPTFSQSPNPKLQITPPPLKFRHFLVLCDFSVAEYPPPPSSLDPPNQKIVRNLGTLTFQLQKDLGTL